MNKEGILCLFLILILAVLSCPTAQSNSIERSLGRNSSDLTHEVDEGLASTLTSHFYENLGQFNKTDVLYYGTIPGGQIGFGYSRISLWMDGAKTRLSLKFINANRVRPEPDYESIHSASFFLGSDNTFLNARTTASITYESLWPGIDLIYRASNSGAKYEFIVGPGSDPSQIGIQYLGHDVLYIDSDSLFIAVGNAEFKDTGLYAYQEDTKIDAKFVLKDSDLVCFQVGEYDLSKPLVIDPLLYSSYFGGSSYDIITRIAIDSEGYIYATGTTDSNDFPIVEAYDASYSAQYSTCFVFKLTPEGDSLVYSTFIGGSQEEGSTFIEVDPSGCVYVGGWTWSSDFPTTEAAYDPSYNGKSDSFILKLNATGNELVYSSFIGGSEEEWDICFTLDDYGSVVITGSTTSPDFPLLNALDDDFNEDVEFFVLKLSDNGSTLVSSTLLGGEGYEAPSDITTCSLGDIYIVGTNYTGTYHNILSECFILKLSGTCDDVIFNYKFRGSRGDETSEMVVDESGDVYVTGYTSSPDFPTVNAYDSSFGGDTDCYVLKLDSSGEFLVFSTFIGGSRSETGASIILDEQRNVYVTGYSESSNFPLVSAYQRTHQGRYDCIVFRLSANGESLLYSTYIGGSHSDYGSSILRTDQGQIYVGGRTWSDDFPTTNAYDDSLGGERDGVIIKMPDLVDSDFDGLIDYLEEEIGTNPNNPDSDGDGIPDSWEYYNGFDPSDSHVPLFEILAFHSSLLVVLLVSSITFSAIGTVVVLRRRKHRFRGSM